MSYICLEVSLHNLKITTLEQATKLADAVKAAIASAVEEQGVVDFAAYTDSSITVELVESAGLKHVRSE